MSHVDRGPQDLLAVSELAGPHSPEQVEVLVDGAIAVRAVHASSVEVAPVLGDLLGGLVVTIGSERIDASIRTRLNSLSQAMKA